MPPTSGRSSAASPGRGASGSGSSGWILRHELSIDPASGIPPFEQVRDAIRAQVESGELVPGFRLPPVRTLATSLDLAANTVARAYKELEVLGIVETRGRAGTFVAGHGVSRAVRAAAATYVSSARSLGLSDDDVLEAVRRALG